MSSQTLRALRAISAATFLTVFLVPAALVAAEDAKPKTNGKAAATDKPAPKETAPAKDKAADAADAGATAGGFAVVQIGPEDVKVVKGAEVAGLRKKVDEENKAAAKKWAEAKQAAAKAKKKFSDAKPAKKQVKVIASALKTEQIAGSIRDKEIKKIEKKNGKGKTNGKASPPATVSKSYR